MKVRLTPGSHLVVTDENNENPKEYKEGDTLILRDDELEVQLNAGVVEEVKDKEKK